MIRLAADLEAVEAPYLRGLNRSFPGWGGKAMFDWCFRRRAGGPAADLLVATDEEGGLVAGSAITYRRALRAGAAAPEPIACMTGSWTAPAARGRGLFRAMIEASRVRAAERGCPLLIAFAAVSSPSARALAAAGAAMLPAAYLTLTGRREGTVVDIEEAVEAFAARPVAAGFGRLVYQPAEWRGQFVDRPHEVTALRLPRGLYALVGGGRLLDVSSSDGASFVDAAIRAGPVSAYSVDPEVVAALTARGCAATPGGVYLLRAGASAAVPERWHFANGDRM